MQPKWTGKTIKSLSVEGFVLPWTSQPVLLQFNGCEDYFLPIFSNVEKLHAAMTYLQGRNAVPKQEYTVKQVDPGGQADFLESVFAGGVRVMVDVQFIDNNRTRYTEVVWEGDEFKLMVGE